jgi:hypothetical protein
MNAINVHFLSHLLFKSTVKTWEIWTIFKCHEHDIVVNETKILRRN